MNNPVATVTYVKGQVWAKAPDGSLRALAVGSQVNADEVIVTAEGAGVELDFGDGIPVAIAGNQEVSMGRDLWDELAADADEAALEDESVQQALAILEQGGDLLEELEDTAAGLNGGAGGGGTSFVQLSRLVIDAPELNRFEFGDNPDAPAALPLQTTQAINYPPTSTNVSLQGDEDTTITGRIPASDPDGDVLTYQIANPPLHGSVVLDPRSGEFVYVPAANYHGTDNFDVSITDGRGNSTSSTVSITVTAVNDLPDTANVNLNTDEDTAVAGQIVASDLDGDTLAYSVATAPVNGSVTVDPATGAFVYTPDVNFNGTDRFIVTVSDGQGGSVSSTVTIGIAALNDAPATTDLNLSTEEDVAVNGQITATDIDGDALNYAVTVAPQNGVLVLNAATGEFTYTPSANYNGSDSFEVTISDGNGGTTTSTVTVGVTPANDAPTVTPVALNNVDEDGNLLITQNDLLTGAGDVDGDALTAINLTLASGNGTLIENGDGTWTFTPSANWNGAVDFEFDLFDGTITVPNTASLTVLPVNDAPTTSNIALTTDEDTAVSGQVTATDIDGDVMSYAVTTVPQNGVLVLNAATGEFTYTPNANYNGSDSFEVTISDGNGGTTTSTVTVGVTPANDAPIAVADAITIDEDTSVVIDVRANDSDIDGDSLTVVAVTQGTNGSVVIDAISGNPIYTPNFNFNGSDSFTYTISDGQDGTSTTTVNITVNAVDDLSVLIPDWENIDEDTTLNGNVLDNDNDVDSSLTVTNFSINGTNYNAGDTATINGVGTLSMLANGDYVFTPVLNYNGSVPAVAYTTNTGFTSTLNIIVDPVNDAPVAVDDNLLFTSGLKGEYWSYQEGVDGDNLTIIFQSLEFIANNPADATFISTQVNYGSIVNGLGGNNGLQQFLGDDSATLSSDPDNSSDGIMRLSGLIDMEEGTYRFRVAADDGFSVRINGTVVAEYHLNHWAEPRENFAVTGLPFEYTVTSAGLQNIEIIYWDTGENASLRVEMRDVNNDAYEILSGDNLYSTGALTIGEDQQLVISADSLLINDYDVEGDTVTIVSVQDAVNGTVSLVGENITFIPDAGYSGLATFTYSLMDSNGAVSEPAKVTVVVTASNDDPQLADHHVVVSQTTMQGLKVDFYNYNEPLDGPNITNLNIIESFIASRTPNANFISTSLFYSEGNNDLGSGNNLQNWIGSDSESLIYLDRQSTTDAILQAQGKIYLEAGTYNFRVRADDGYSIKINGSTVAEINYVQSPTGSIHDPFTITQGGYYDLEALYWDQGGQFVFEVEISSDGGATYAPLDTASLVHEPEALLYTVTATELLANATDIDGDSLSLLRVDNAVGGSVTFDINTGVIAFAIEPGFIGTPSFDYTVADGNGGQATATTFINVVQNQYQGSESNDILTGSSSNDQLVALDGDDTLTGGAGSDVLFGGLGADTFVWNFSDAGSPGAPAVDKVGDFNLAQGDVLHLADLLQGEESNPLTDYLHFDSDGSNTRVHISSNGGYAGAGYDAGATDQIVVLEGISLSGTNTEIIAQLQNLNNLQVD